MKLSKAAETQRMSHRGFQSLCHIRVRTVLSQLPPRRCDLVGLRHEQEQGIGERTFMDKQETQCLTFSRVKHMEFPV